MRFINIAMQNVGSFEDHRKIWQSNIETANESSIQPAPNNTRTRTPPKSGGAVVVGLQTLGTACAFSGSLRGFEFFSGFPAEPNPAYTAQYPAESMRDITLAVGQPLLLHMVPLRLYFMG